jgi:hypothetical protein
VSFSPQQRQARSSDQTRGAIQGTAIATPASVVAVWLMNHHVLSEPMPLEVAVAFASMVNGGLIWLVQWLPNRRS